MKITIPATLDEAISNLNGLDRLLTAKEWEKAAIVATFVRLSDSQAHVTSDMRNLYSCQEFAELGIHGLQSHNTVRKYVRYWTEGAKREHPNPGEEIELPTQEFPPTLTIELVVPQAPSHKTSTPTLEKQAETNPVAAQLLEQMQDLSVKSTGSPDLDGMSLFLQALDLVTRMENTYLEGWRHYHQYPEAWFNEGTREALSDLVTQLSEFLTVISNPVPDDVSALDGAE